MIHEALYSVPVTNGGLPMKNFDLQKITEEQLQRAAEQPNETEERPEFWAADFAASGVGKEGGGGTEGSISP